VTISIAIDHQHDYYDRFGSNHKAGLDRIIISAMSAISCMLHFMTLT